MLSRKENAVMSVLCKEGQEKEALLISPTDIVKMSGESSLTVSAVEKVVSDLSTDRYLDLVYSDRHGERVYCITLTKKGKGYLRGIKSMRRSMLFRLAMTVVFAVISFVIGLILRAIFK